MKYIEFFDIDGNKITVQNSSLATQIAYRVYVKSRKDQEDEDPKNVGECLHLNEMQASLLVNALKDLINDEVF